MPTLKDVAKLAGVSVATVSYVVNNNRKISPLTRARVEQAIAQLGFVPNAAGRMLALQKSGVGAAPTSAPNAGPEISSDAGPGIPPANSSSSLEDAEGVAALDADGAPSLSSNQTPPAPEAARYAQTRRLLLRLVRAAQPIPRVELARRLGVHRSTVTELTKPLMASGLLREEKAAAPRDAGQTAMGRPPTGLTFESAHQFFIGVNIGVRGTQVGSATLSGEILDEEEFETPAEAQAALQLVRASIERLCARASGRTLKIIGVSVPGPTNAERSSLLYAPHIGWHDVAIAEALRLKPCSDQSGQPLDVPVIVENDATAAAMYESRLRLRDMKNGSLTDFILVRSGTGIGVGLVLGGEVYRGKGQGEGLAGEFGHMTIVAGGKPCVCGNRGCWERYASASAAASLYMGDRVQLGAMKTPRYVEIVARAEAGELRAKATLERMGEYLGIGIANVITGFGVQHVIISGRIVYGWKFIRDPLREAVGQSMAGKLAEWSVVPGEPRGAGLGGALEVAAEEFLTGSLGK